ncbi:MAG: hypothetical protein IT578_09910 [Verrucomicrobiae bacterium]|nr:hypothetical protein [Verrucomicrobiae bacterium]
MEPLEFQAGRELALNGRKLPTPVSDSALLGYRAGLTELELAGEVAQRGSLESSLGARPELLARLQELLRVCAGEAALNVAGVTGAESAAFWRRLADHVSIFCASQKSLDERMAAQRARVGSWDEQKDAGSTFLGLEFHWAI